MLASHSKVQALAGAQGKIQRDTTDYSLSNFSMNPALCTMCPYIPGSEPDYNHYL